MLLKHFFTGKIAHSSYILAGQKSCAVIDPQRDVDIYISEAQAMGVKITHIIQTHLHADFISGHMDLAQRTGAKIYVAKLAHCAFDHVPLVEGDTIEFEHLELRVMETPGHTPEHLSYVVIDRSRAESPTGAFVGDTLFVGDVGRPDLFPGMAQELAGKLFHSLHDKILKLPDYVEVYPAHGAGSLCGRAISAKWTSTIGYERKFNTALQIRDKSSFIKSLTENMPPAPDHFGRCSEVNRQGPTRLADLPQMEKLSVDKFKKQIDRPDTVVLDTRSYHAFASQHISGAWHIDLNLNFPTFAGWVLPTDKDILLVVEDYQKALEANIWARRVGVDRMVGYLEGGMIAWAMAGYKTSHIELISVEDLHEMITGGGNFILVDVRAPQEFADNHLEGAVNIPVADLRTRYEELPKKEKIVLICSSGVRSSLGASILEQHGFEHIYNVAGGMAGYSAAGYARECRLCVNPHGSRFFANSDEIEKPADTK